VYFGQEYRPPEHAGVGCGACDVCLGDLEPVPDSTVIAQKIISCVARCGQAFGGAHIADVLRGSRTQKILDRKHDRLSTFGLMRGVPKALLLGYINQLVDQGLIDRSGGEYPVIAMSEVSADVLRGNREARLLEPKRELAAAGRARVETRPMDDRPLAPEEVALFDTLRALRMRIAQERALPPYVIFTDATLREMARLRPATVQAMAGIRGMGERKLTDLGPRFASFIAEYCTSHGLSPGAESATPRASRRDDRGPRGETTGSRAAYFALYRQGATVEDAAKRVGHRGSTAGGYLIEFIAEERPPSVEPWIDAPSYRLIADTAAKLGAERLKPIFEHFGGSITYEQIQIVMAHLRAMQG
jgi:ATP-dependent DNA helicase RecQ